MGGQFVPGPRDPLDGHLFVRAEDGLHALPFDLARKTATGARIRVTDDIVVHQYGRARFSVSRSGTLLYVPADTRSTAATLAWIDAAGRTQPIPAPPGDYAVPRISPNGARVALQIRRPDDNNLIGVLDHTRGPIQRLPVPGHSIRPVWMTDGRSLIFRPSLDGPGQAFVIVPADGSQPPKPIVVQDLIALGLPGSWSPEGRLFGASGEAIWSLTPTSTSSAVTDVIARVDGAAENVIVSPTNGRLLAFDAQKPKATAHRRAWTMGIRGRGSRACPRPSKAWRSIRSTTSACSRHADRGLAVREWRPDVDECADNAPRGTSRSPLVARSLTRPPGRPACSRASTAV